MRYRERSINVWSSKETHPFSVNVPEKGKIIQILLKILPIFHDRRYDNAIRKQQLGGSGPNLPVLTGNFLTGGIYQKHNIYVGTFLVIPTGKGAKQNHFLAILME